MSDPMEQSDLVPLLGSGREVEARSTREAADEAFAWQCLKDALGELVEEARGRATKSMISDASEKQGVFDADGVRLGTVSYTPGALRAEVLSKAKLIAWVKEKFPTEIVEDVNPAFIKKLMDEAVARAETDGVVSGEVLPGIHVGEGNPVLRIVKTRDGRDVGRQLLGRMVDQFRAVEVPYISTATCGTCMGTGEAAAEECPSCSIRPKRCPNCDHLLGFHDAEAGCWRTMSAGEGNLVCGCLMRVG